MRCALVEVRQVADAVVAVVVAVKMMLMLRVESESEERRVRRWGGEVCMVGGIEGGWD